MNIDEFLSAQTPALSLLPRPSPKLRPGDLTRRFYYEIDVHDFLREFEFEGMFFDGPYQVEDIATSQNILSKPVTGCADTEHGDILILGVLHVTIGLPPDCKVNWAISDLRRISTIAPNHDQVREGCVALMGSDSWTQLIWKYAVTDVYYAAEFKLTIRDEGVDYSLNIKDLERDGVVRRAEAASDTGATFSYDSESVELTVKNNLGLPFAVGGYYLSRDFK